MRGLNSVEQFLRRFRRSKLNCIEHFQVSNMQDGVKCLSCALDAERVRKTFMKMSFVDRGLESSLRRRLGKAKIFFPSRDCKGQQTLVKCPIVEIKVALLMRKLLVCKIRILLPVVQREIMFACADLRRVGV